MNSKRPTPRKGNSTRVLKPQTIQKYEGQKVRRESQLKYHRLFLQVDFINTVLHSVLEETRATNQQLNAEELSAARAS